LGGEPQVRLDAGVPYGGKEYRWNPYGRQVLDFYAVIAPKGEQHLEMVAYAWTRFLSDKPQDAMLAIGSDDSFVAWLNGEKVAEHIEIRGNYLDDDRVFVHLREGENTLLLKVENGDGPWGAVARLLPPNLEQPLLNFEWTDADCLGRFENYQLPDMTIEYLDSRGQPVGTQRCSGFRARNWTRPLYQLYAPAPEPTPASVRVRIQQDGFSPFEKIVSWNEAWREPVEVAADGALTVAGHVVDADTGSPIIGARIVGPCQMLCETSGPDGSFQFHGVSPFGDLVKGSAPGYIARYVHVDLHRSLPLEVRLKRGGKTVRGRVTDDQGNPVEDAGVWSWSPAVRWYWDDVTDREGQFLLAGIPSSVTNLYVTIQHLDYVPIKWFMQDIGDAQTKDVDYRMQRGAVVTGRVTAQTGSRSLNGVRVAWGEGRDRSSAFPDVFTDVDGRYRLTDVPPGPTNVFAVSDEFAPAMRQINAGLGYTVDVNFGLEPGQGIAGRVVGSDGRPISGATVFVDDWNGVHTLERETVTDADGRFVLHQMPPTAVTLCAVTDDLSTSGIEVVSGNHYDTVLQLAPRRTIRVWPKDSDRGG
jgi:protocatechuate 3,4-dioxygenase beta subunit